MTFVRLDGGLDWESGGVSVKSEQLVGHGVSTKVKLNALNFLGKVKMSL